MEDDRIETTRNRVFVQELAFGKDSPIAMKTNDNFVYRVTGMDQVEDIIISGYVRSKDKVKGDHNNELFWTRGGDKLFYYDKRPVLEAPYTKVQDGQMGAISLEDLTAIWIFNEKEKRSPACLHGLRRTKAKTGTHPNRANPGRQFRH